MIIQGKSVSHGRYLKHYLVSKRDNDIKPEIFKISGTATPGNYDLSADEIIMSSMMSKGDKNIYHAQINPAIGEDDLSDEQWQLCIDSLLKGLGLDQQKYVAIMHTKNGRKHMHLKIDRYDWDRGILISDSHDYKIHKSVATELEETLGHAQTIRKRDYKKEQIHKDTLTELWYNSKTASEFIESAEALGYQIGKGLDKRPFKAITPDGKSLDLVRQLKGIKTEEVASRMQYEKLQTEAEALRRITIEKKNKIELKRKEFIDNLSDIQPEIQDQNGNHLSDIDRKYQELLKKSKEQQEQRLRQLRQNQNEQGMSY